jgi:hypothetical protein
MSDASMNFKKWGAVFGIKPPAYPAEEAEEDRQQHNARTIRTSAIFIYIYIVHFISSFP